MDRAPIQKRKLSDEVRDRLIAEIEGGQLAPGAALPSERELMELLGVGRPAIREAMQSLQGLGLIVVRHGERPRVAEPQLDLLAEQLALTMRHILTHDGRILTQLKEARALLETELARRAAQARTDADLDALGKILDEQARHADSFKPFMKLDGQFHAKLAEISGNDVLASVVKAIFVWLERFHTESVRRAGLEELTLSEHREILAAIKSGNSDDAGRAMNDHLMRANALYQQRHED